MTSLCMMFLFQNAIDPSDELGSVISRCKNTIRFFLLTHACAEGQEAIQRV